MKVEDYVGEIKRLYFENGREESFYPILKLLLEGLYPDITVIVAPGKEDFGFPDFKVIRNNSIVGYIEAKKPGTELDRVETSEQLRRYLEFVPNLILTDFNEFRLYRNGKLVKTVRLAVDNLKTLGVLTLKPKSSEEFFSLLKTFVSFSIPPINKIDRLAKELAVRSRVLKEAIAKYPKNKVIEPIYSSLKTHLLPNIDELLFSDILAQTITYSLIVARINAKGKALTIGDVPRYIPQKLKVIKSILALFILEQTVEPVPDEIRWAIEDILNVVNAYSGTINHKDLATYFYEPFLREYDPELREIRGVYYTPKEVIGFINRAVNYILEGMGYASGFANENVKVLDPCAGTASFIADAVDRAVELYKEKWGDATVLDFVESHILKDFYAFELLVAPYVIAHLILESLLNELGYRGDEVFRLYLTNTLTLTAPGAEQHPSGHLFEEALEDEKARADKVKRAEPIISIVSNPPYSGISANNNPWIEKLLKSDINVGNETIQSYYEVDGEPLRERKVWLQDDYVKFIRFAQWKIAKTGKGVIGFITNHAYLDNPTFRGMRQSLLKTFDRIYILNLHGNKRKKEPDENVFDIQQGVAIGIFVKDGSKTGDYARVFYFSTLEKGLRSRTEKFHFLEGNGLESLKWKEIKPVSPFYFFVPTNITEGLVEEYEKGWKITDIFKEGTTGIVTARDKLVIDFDKRAIIERIKMFINDEFTDEEVKKILSLKENYQWRVKAARQELKNDLEKYDPSEYIIPILYRPFDVRWIFYHPAVVWRTRINVMIHMLRGENVGLVTVRQVKASKKWRHSLAANKIMESTYISNKTSEISYFFPLYLYIPKDTYSNENFFKKHREKITFPIKPKPNGYVRVPNFTEEFQAFLKERYGSKATPEDVFHYIYAILYHPEYRSRYAEFLKYDFPRIPFPKDYELLKSLAHYGERLVKLHTMDFALDKPPARFMGEGDGIIGRIKYGSQNQRLWINKSQYLEPIPSEVWEYHIGGYQVLHKWLKSRKGRKLDFKTFAKVIYALKETIEIQEDLIGIPLPP